MTATDEDWRNVAVASREALALLGYGIAPRCLPGEPDCCGGGYAQHVAAHLGALQAVAEHHLQHLPGLADMSADVYRRTMAEVTSGCTNLPEQHR